MAFDNIIGQHRIKEILKRALENQRIPHALLFQGNEGVGKEAIALELAKALICQVDKALGCGTCSDCKRISKLSHPDVNFIFPMPKKATAEDKQDILNSIFNDPYFRTVPWTNPSISIDQIRELKRSSAMSSFENKGRVVIITEAHRMTVEAANSLLKILEEPPDRMNIILITDHLNLLLPTIISRCQTLRFDPLSWDDIENALINRKNIPVDKAKLIAKLSFGNYRRALELLDEQLDQKREEVLDILRTVIRSDLHRIILVEQLVAKKDKKVIKEFLELLLLWFRDALIYTENDNDQNLIVNIDKLETLEKFCNSFEELNFEEIVVEIEKALEHIDRNVFVNLILINLFYHLQHHLRRKHV